MDLLQRLRLWARTIRQQAHLLYLVAKDPRTPWYAKALAAAVVAYALSPIDLIPDFIPVIGFLDDVILVPLGIVLAMKLVPSEVRAECEARARLADPVS